MLTRAMTELNTRRVTHLARWLDPFGRRANRIAAFIESNIESASEIWTPPYDDGVTEQEMIATYVAKFGALHA